MKKTILETDFDTEKLEALRLYLSRKNGTLECKIDDYLEELYHKIVPAPIRDFISSKQNEQCTSSDKQRISERKRQFSDSHSAKNENLKSEVSHEISDFNV